MLTLTQLFTICLTYLAILFGSAYATEKGYIPQVIAKHPATRVLSLGVFAGAIAFHGAVGFAAQYGSGFLLYFIGSSAAFFIAPVLLGPVSRTALAYKLGSLSDVFAFRYPAAWVGGTISLLMLIGVLPLLALQIQAVSVSIHLLNQELSKNVLAVLFCLMMSVFAILFGARHLSTRDKHQGLVVAIGLESIIKLAAMMILAFYCITQVFGSTRGLANWLTENEPLLSVAYEQLGNGASRSLLLTFFAATVAMPHVYHMLITENDDERALVGARWGFPLYMLLLSLCIPPILWAAIRLSVATQPEFYAIGIGLASDNHGIVILAFIASLAAASGVLIVTTLALASMTLNHVVLPFYRPRRGVDVYRIILNMRRFLIAAIIAAAFGVYQLLGEGQSLISLGIVAFVAVLQFLPGLVGGIHWRGANKTGLIAGLLAGYLVWFSTLLWPLILNMLVGKPFIVEINDQSWQLSALTSLLANVAFFVIGSLLSKTTAEELLAAEEFMSDSNVSVFRGEIQASSVSEMESNLATALGRAVSSREVNLALTELRYPQNENRPFALGQLRKQMESNLSSMLGQTIAHRIMHATLPLKPASQTFHALENYLEDYRSQLTGLAAELDDLRRYHRQILHVLPTAVFSIDQQLVIRTWNHAMAEITGIRPESIIGSSITSLPEPWREPLNTFIYDDLTHRLKEELIINNVKILINLHKASLIGSQPREQGDQVIVIEDLTESQHMEDQLIHNERLATIGQLAAGIAHEIGNPVTGIAFLAQNLRIDNPELAELSSQILEQTERITNIMQSLVNFAYSSKGGTKNPNVPVELQVCIDEAINLLSLSQRNENISFRNHCDARVYTLGDPQRLSQVFVNLLANALDASVAGDQISITNRFEEGSVVLDIIDQGCGIASDQINRVFEPFFTTKDPGQGTGLGLAIVATIVDEHHGSISAEAVSGGGTRVILKLPQYIHGNSDLSQELTSS